MVLDFALSLAVREKSLIQHLHDYGVTSTYTAASTNEVQVQLDADEGLIQGISDNFDADLSTQNGIKQTHSLATIIVQNGDHPKGR